jgi:hypothetical protein
MIVPTQMKKHSRWPVGRLLQGICSIIIVLEPARAITFEDTLGSAGINSDHTYVTESYWITGQAWGDYDNDGLEDLYLTNSSGSNTLYKNLGDGNFEVSTLNPQVSLSGEESGGATFVDYDNDGDQDLLVLNYGLDTLFENTGTSFVDVTSGSGLEVLGKGETAAWGDFNNDSYLDLYVANYSYDDNPPHPLTQDRFYINDGDGTFTETSHLLNVERMDGPAYSVTFVDYDNDRDLDIYVVNDKLYGNLLWRNDGAGCGLWCFTDVSVATGADRPAFGMGIAVGDYDLDGDWDFYFSSIDEQVLLQSQIAQGSDSFLEVSDPAGVNADALGWGTVFVDFDNDGWEDIYLATASQQPGRTNRVFLNQGDSTFLDISEISGASNAGFSVGVAFADYDLDGRIDLVLGNRGDRYYLYRNISTAGAWLSVELNGRGPINRDAVGTLAVLELSDGRMLRRRVHIGSSIGSDHQRALHFGLGAASPVELTLTWPDGTVEVINTLPSNQTITRQSPLPEMILSAGFE